MVKASDFVVYREGYVSSKITQVNTIVLGINTKTLKIFRICIDCEYENNLSCDYLSNLDNRYLSEDKQITCRTVTIGVEVLIV